jgi:hypothetical protein
MDEDRLKREQEAERKKLEFEEKRREDEITHQRKLVESKLEVKAKYVNFLNDPFFDILSHAGSNEKMKLKWQISD